MIDFGKTLEASGAASNALSQLIGAAMAAERAEQGRRDYLGGSRLGEECLRRLGYEFHGASEDPGSDPSPEVLRIFQRGHDCEARMADYLRKAGFALRTEKEDGKQFGFYAAGGKIRGHADGVIVGWMPNPALDAAGVSSLCWASDLDFPMLWENKGLNDKNYKKVVKEGLKKSKPLYYAQIQLYMAYFDVPRALFTIENQDTCEIWAEVMELDKAAAQEASDRGVKVIQSRAPEELPRLGKDADAWACAYCPFKARCHGAPAVPASLAAAAPSWMAG